MLGVGSRGPLGVSAATPVVTTDHDDSMTERDALIVLSTVEGLGPATLARLITRLGSARRVVSAATQSHAVATLLAANADGDGTRHPMLESVAIAIREASRRGAEILADIAATGAMVVTIEDAAYPARLRTIELPPHALFVDGNVDALASRHALAVVGTRHASEAGRLTATRIGAAVARAGASVVSGLAVGIDGAAHAAVVELGGTTVAVLGGGLRRLYPAAHRGLARAIVDSGGALVSEFPPDTVPVAGLFPRRNRLISGLSDATVVVQAGMRSGALITAEWALEQGRDCFVVPGAIDDDLAAGCLALLRSYTGQVRVVAGIAELIEDLEITDVGDAAAQVVGPSVAAVLIGLDEVPRRIARELLDGHTTADELVTATGLPIAVILAALTLLEARRLVVSAYGRYRPAGVLAVATEARRGGTRRRRQGPKKVG